MTTRLAAALWLLGSALPASAASAPAPIDACALLDAAQIEQALGQPVAAGSRHDAGIESNGAWSSSCVWKLATSSAGERGGFVILNAMRWPAGSGRAREFLDSFRDAATQGVLARAPVERAFGDEALWWGDGLAVRRGDVSFGLSVHAPRVPSVAPGAAEARLAPLVLDRLGAQPGRSRQKNSVRS
ncbi:hypothetical protein [Solimonas variicoloris]|uniref:hypothetical protein n=1 Tax=Solimonas variicoloris TaxID=254408 RepID=UPI00036090A6|nr:hypothetical protein [Solimonas variicoloris]